MIFDFKTTLEEFEHEVVCRGISVGRFTKKCNVPTKHCKLSKTSFSTDMGKFVNTDEVLTVDYYGYLKKSKGFKEEFPEKGIVWSSVVHFAAIRIEDVASITTNANIIAAFPKLKNEILIRRGFKKR